MIISLFAQGVSNWDTESHIKKMYGLEVSAEMTRTKASLGWDNICDKGGKYLLGVYC